MEFLRRVVDPDNGYAYLPTNTAIREQGLQNRYTDITARNAVKNLTAAGWIARARVDYNAIVFALRIPDHLAEHTEAPLQDGPAQE